MLKGLSLIRAAPEHASTALTSSVDPSAHHDSEAALGAGKISAHAGGRKGQGSVVDSAPDRLDSNQGCCTERGRAGEIAGERGRPAP